jgi:hypothetical protein
MHYYNSSIFFDNYSLYLLTFLRFGSISFHALANYSIAKTHSQIHPAATDTALTFDGSISDL